MEPELTSFYVAIDFVGFPDRELMAAAPEI
jgi:hypothetical protein